MKALSHFTVWSLRGLHRLAVRRRPWASGAGPVLGLVCCTATALSMAAPISVGSGSIETEPRGIDQRAPAAPYRTEAMLRQAAATNQWYSSLLFNAAPEPIYVQPLAAKFSVAGFELSRPVKKVVATERRDVEIQYPHLDPLVLRPTDFELGQPKLAQRGDWSIGVTYPAKSNGSSSADHLDVTLAHGSPFAFLRWSRGDLRLQLPLQSQTLGPITASVGPNGAAPTRLLAVRVGDVPYAVFGPSGSSWERQSPNTWVLHVQSARHLPDGGNYASVASLPDVALKDNQSLNRVLTLFQGHAFAFITDTRVAWHYDQAHATVRTEFSASTEDVDAQGSPAAPPLLGLYPHQWFDNPGLEPAFKPLAEESGLESSLRYGTLRGDIKIIASNRFAVDRTYTGLVPFWPGVDLADKSLSGGPGGLPDLKEILAKDVSKARPMMLEIGTGPYWQGKGLQRITQLMNVAEQQGDLESRDKLLKLLKDRVVKWFSGTDSKDYFLYDAALGTVVAYPEEYFAVQQLNDHHFHYGYWIHAMADIALRDPQWAASQNWGGMVDWLVKDIATSERGRAVFPFLRNFDPYESHSWASGTGLGSFGNNQESSSEAINAWAGLILWGQIKNDPALRDLGIWLFTSETHAIQHYWFDQHHLVFPPEYQNVEVSMLFGGKMAHNTWWIDEPREIKGINLLPITTASTYLAADASYVNKNLGALAGEMATYASRGKHANPEDIWQDIFAEYQSLADPKAGLLRWDRWGSFELGDTRSHALHYMLFLQQNGVPDLSITADTTLFSVFRKADGHKTYLAYNTTDQPLAVRFSDGVQLTVAPHSLGTHKS